MSAYEWSDAERKRCVPGASVAYVRDGIGQRCVIRGLDREGDIRVTFTKPFKGYTFVPMRQLNPLTLRPPTLVWLASTARRKLGAQLYEDGRYIVIRQADGMRIAAFDDCDAIDARSSCAVWLAALPEVQP